jgi:hypothetical protein
MRNVSKTGTDSCHFTLRASGIPILLFLFTPKFEGSEFRALFIYSRACVSHFGGWLSQVLRLVRHGVRRSGWGYNRWERV